MPTKLLWSFGSCKGIETWGAFQGHHGSRGHHSLRGITSLGAWTYSPWLAEPGPLVCQVGSGGRLGFWHPILGVEGSGRI